ncbi:MAG TPA: hypothetical protein VGR91_14080 [Stellaceae bacterium]|nr:hypothetical protein [Stellaceae bacterium]
MGFLYFIIGVVVGLSLLAALPLFVAILGVAIAVGFVIALPLLFSFLILVGIIAVTPALAYGLAIAVLIIILWTGGRRQRPSGGG